MPQTNLKNEIERFYENYQGAEDNRTDAEKLRDYNQEEIVASAMPVSWEHKTPVDFRSFPELNQLYTGKCVAFTTSKLALINFWLKTKEMLKFSPNSIYTYRSNKPSAGMVGDDAFKIWRDKGISLEAVAKSDQVTEDEPYEVNLLAQEIAKGFKLGNYITISNGDFDRVASTIQVTGKGVMSWFYFTSREWSMEIPRVMDNLSAPNSPGASRHSVTVVDYGLLNGVEVLKIEDSAHFGGRSVRYITREFFNKRNFLNAYPMNFHYEEIPEPNFPNYSFSTDLEFGDNNNDIRVLQDVLRIENVFPANVESTGYYGSITAKAVYLFQKKYQVASDAELDQLAGMRVGAKTRAKLNELCS